MNFILYATILINIINFVKAWDTEELEIFDLVEEVNKNFYELMGVTQDATIQEIKRSFRNLSIYLHPDKNDAEDANIQFRNLVSVYEVLKDPSRREKYNKVLKDGLPNWKSAVYYYRRVRKMGLAEMSAILFVIISIGQYFVAWAAYIEKKYTAEQLFGSKLKKLHRKNKSNVNMDAILSSIPTPSIYNTLPFQIPKAFWNTPKTVKSFLQTLYEYKRREVERRKLEAEELEKQKLIEEELAKEKESKKGKKETIRKRKQAQVVPEKTDAELSGYSQIKAKKFTDDDSVKLAKTGKVQVSGGFWTDEDLIELVKLVRKYPGGTVNRWEVIADSMNRSVSEVTFMAAKLKENGYRIPGQAENSLENDNQDVVAAKKVKVKKTANPILVPEINWSQEQQRALEAAIVKYRKTSSVDRWQKIANSVPGKTKEECLVRYKYLVELVKSQKESPKGNEDNDPEKPDSITNHGEFNQEYTEKESKKEEVNSVAHTKHSIQNKDLNAEDIEEINIKKKGKSRNKRKEKKQRQQFSSDEELSDYNFE